MFLTILLEILLTIKSSDSYVFSIIYPIRVCFIHLLNNVIPCIYNYYILFLDKTITLYHWNCIQKTRGYMVCVYEYMCVCMSVCFCVYIYIYIYVHMHIVKYVYMCLYVCVHMYMCMSVCACVYVHMCIFINVYFCVCMHMSCLHAIFCGECAMSLVWTSGDSIQMWVFTFQPCIEIEPLYYYVRGYLVCKFMYSPVSASHLSTGALWN